MSMSASAISGFTNTAAAANSDTIPAMLASVAARAWEASLVVETATVTVSAGETTVP
jgi:hypothetical protein